MTAVEQFIDYRDPARAHEIQIRWLFQESSRERTLQTWSLYRRLKTDGQTYTTLENAYVQTDLRGDFIACRSRMGVPGEALGQDLSLIPDRSDLFVHDAVKGTLERHPGFERNALPVFLILPAALYLLLQGLDWDSSEPSVRQVIPTAYPRFVGVRNHRVEITPERLDERHGVALFRFFTRTPFGEEEDRMLAHYDLLERRIERIQAPSMGARIVPIDALRPNPYPYLGPAQSLPLPLCVDLRSEVLPIGKESTLLVHPKGEFHRKILLVDTFASAVSAESPQVLRHALGNALAGNGIALYHLDELWGKTGVFPPREIRLETLRNIWRMTLDRIDSLSAVLLLGPAADWSGFFRAWLPPETPILFLDPPDEEKSPSESAYWRARVEGWPSPAKIAEEPALLLSDLPQKAWVDPILEKIRSLW